MARNGNTEKWLYWKIQLVKTFVIPTFLISVIKYISKQVDSTIYNIIWKGKDKIKRLALERL